LNNSREEDEGSVGVPGACPRRFPRGRAGNALSIARGFPFADAYADTDADTVLVAFCIVVALTVAVALSIALTAAAEPFVDFLVPLARRRVPRASRRPMRRISSIESKYAFFLPSFQFSVSEKHDASGRALRLDQRRSTS